MKIASFLTLLASFPHDALEPIERNAIDFSLFGLHIQVTWYALCIVMGILVAFLFSIPSAKHLNISIDDLSLGLCLGVIIGIIGARLYYCLFSWDQYKDEPITILTEIHNGGLAIHGGILAAFIFVLLFCKLKKIPFLDLAEIVAIGFLIGQIFGRWGNFFNQEAHGGLVPGYPNLDVQRHWLSRFLPNFIVNQMYIAEYREGIQEYVGYYQPTFLYESILNFIGFILICLLRRYHKKYKPGDGFFFYCMWYGIVRFCMEIFRTDALMISKLKVAQVISILLFIFGLVGIVFYHRFSDKNRTWQHPEGYLPTTIEMNCMIDSFEQEYLFYEETKELPSSKEIFDKIQEFSKEIENDNESKRK